MERVAPAVESPEGAAEGEGERRRLKEKKLREIFKVRSAAPVQPDAGGEKEAQSKGKGAPSQPPVCPSSDSQRSKREGGVTRQLSPSRLRRSSSLAPLFRSPCARQTHATAAGNAPAGIRGSSGGAGACRQRRARQAVRRSSRQCVGLSVAPEGKAREAKATMAAAAGDDPQLQKLQAEFDALMAEVSRRSGERKREREVLFFFSSFVCSRPTTPLAAPAPHLPPLCPRVAPHTPPLFIPIQL